MASRQVKRSSSARVLASDAAASDVSGRPVSPLPYRGSPTMVRNKSMTAVGGGVPAGPKRRHGLENMAPDSPSGRKQGSPEVAKYKKSSIIDSPRRVERDLPGPLVETNSNRPSPSKRKLEYAKPSDDDVSVEKPDSAGRDAEGVRVIIRVRPMSRPEQLSESEPGLVLEGDCSIKADGQQYTFDTVAGEATSQANMFEVAGRSAVENCIAGFNSSIFAYGQTGSGKTHTMTGQMDGSEARGLTPRVFEHMFRRIMQEEKARPDKELKYICKCSFLEIYNEQITDLLEPSSKNLQVREDKKNGIYVEGLREEMLETVDDVQKLILKGTSNRTVAATNMNAASSRSHSVFTCTILSRNKNVSDGTVNVRRSRLNLVDLAGSERQKQTGAQGERLKEASKINSSLSALGNVIKVLAEIAQSGKPRHVPYRDSRLTYLLQESLGGNAKTVMIANVSPSSSCFSETVSTLKFAQRAKAVQNKAVVNEETTNDVNVLKQQIRRLKDELLRMKTAPPARSPSPEIDPQTPAAHATSGATSSDAVSPDFLELTAKITELSQETLLMESFQGKLAQGLGVLDQSPERNITTRRRRQWADVARDVTDGPVSPELTLSPPVVKTRSPIPFSPEGFEVLADSPGRALRRRSGFSDSEADVSEDEDSDKENSGGFQTTPGSGGGRMQSTPSWGGSRQTSASRRLQLTPQSGEDQGTPNSAGVQITPVSGGSQATPSPGGVQVTPSPNVSQVTPGSGGFKVTPGSEEAQLAFLQKLRFSTDSDMPRCVESPESPLFGRDRRSKLRDPSQERNLLLTPPFTPTQSLESPGPGQPTGPPPPSPLEVEGKLLEATGLVVDDVSTMLDVAGDVSTVRDVPGDVSRRSYQSESFFSSNGDDEEAGEASPEAGTPRGGARQSVESIKTPPPEARVAPVEEPQTPATPGFGAQQRWVNKPDTPEKSPTPGSVSESLVSDVDDSVDVAAPDSPVSSSPPKPSPRTVTFTAAPKTPDVGTGFKDFELVDGLTDPGLQMVIRVDRSVQGPSESSLAGSVAELLGADAEGLSDAQLRAVEGVLAGALRRESVAEEQVQQLEGELQALRRIVREYEHDYECNKKLVDCREDKLARLEQLADGVLSESDFIRRERAAAQMERAAMQEKIDRHPEVTRFAMENMRLVEQLRRYEDFYGCGEREALQKEVQQLRDLLAQALEAGPVLTGPSRSGDKPRPSVERLKLCGPSDPLVASLEADVAYYKELADVQRKEAEEAKHTLGGAIVSNAKMASFFEEIQKENDRLLQKHRAIREATAGMVAAAVVAHGVDPESQWLQAHAAELAALRADDKENSREIDALQGQLRDAREAVRAAGELTTRMQKAEERAKACEEVSARTEQTVRDLRRKADVVRRQHASELAAAEKGAREARSKKGTICQMCHMSERVVFHLPEGPEEVTPSKKVLHRSQTEPGRTTPPKSNKKGFWFWGKGKSKDEPVDEPQSDDSEPSLERRESMASNPPGVEGTGGHIGSAIVHGKNLDTSLESLPLTPR